MKKTKTIFKRTVAVLLTLLMMISLATVGISSTAAANVNVAPTGLTCTGGYVYFDNSVGNWNDSVIAIVIGHSSWSSVYQMTKVPNTNLYYYSMPNWSGANYIAFTGTSSKWGDGGWSTSNLTNATHYTASFSYDLYSGSTYVFKPNAAANGSAVTGTYLSGGYGSLNVNQTLNAQTANYGSSTYTTSSAAATVTASTYKVSGNGASTTSTGTATKGTTGTTTYSSARTATVTLSYSSMDSGYTFKGWYNSSGTQVGTGSTYTYTCNGTAATYNARFEQKRTQATLSVSQTGGTGSVQINGTTQTSAVVNLATTASISVTAPTGYVVASVSGGGISATPNAKTYTGTTSAITDDTTIAVTYTAGTYGITAASDDAAKGSASASVNSVTYDGTVVLTATPTTGTSYGFSRWNITGTYEVVTGTVYTATFTIRPTSNISAVAVFVGKTSTFTIAAGTGGSVTNAGEHELRYPNSVTTTATADPGYVFSNWTVSFSSGASYREDGTYRSVTTLSKSTLILSPASQDVVATFTANFVPASYVMTVSSNNNDLGMATSAVAGDNISLVATPATGAHFVSWTISSGTYNAVTGSTTSSTFVIDPTSDITAVANFAANTGTVTYAANSNGSVSNSGANSTTYPGVSSSTATPSTGYNFTSWTISGGTAGVDYEITSGSTSTAAITIRPITNNASITATASFTIKTYTVRFFDDEGNQIGTSSTVNHGASATPPTPPEKTGYTFDSWDYPYTNITADTDITAEYTANSYSVSVGTATGGTAATTAANVTYPGTVTLTATPGSRYKFISWTITGDYDIVGDGTLASASLTIRPKANITATPSFALGQYLTVHSFSADNYDYVYLWEGNGTDTLFPNGEFPGAQSTATSTFNGISWKSGAELELTSGYSTDVGAILSGSVASTGTDIYVDFSQATSWGSGHYLSVTSSGNSGKIMSSANTDGANTYTPSGDAWLGSGTLVSGSTYKWTIPAANLANLTSYGFTVWANNESTYGQVWQTNVSHTSYDSTKNTYTVGSANTYNTGRQTYCYSTLATGNTTPQTGNYSLTPLLYDNGTWKGVDEVWLYQSGSTELITDRRSLLDLVSSMTATYNGGTNAEDYTNTSWSAFTSAYTAAYNTSGAGASTQSAIDAAEDALQLAFDNLEQQQYYNVSVSQSGATGTVVVGGTTVSTATGTAQTAQGSTPAVTVTAPEGFYIASITGTAGITATNVASYSGNTGTISADNMTIAVTYAPYLSVTAAGGTGGSATASATGVMSGASVTLTATPATGYHFVSWSITGTYTGSIDSEEITLTVSSDVSATANFAANSGTVSFASGSNGSVSNSGENTVTHPGTVSSTATPATGYHFVEWTVTGGVAGTDFSFTSGSASTAEITVGAVANGANVTLTASFAINTYTVRFLDYDGTTVLKTEIVNHGANATPPTDPTRKGYTFDGWQGTYIGITSDTDITATYVPGVYTISVSAGTGGTAATEADTVTYPGTVVLSATPAEGYTFANWTITGAYDPVGTATLTTSIYTLRPSENITAVANFVKIKYITVHVNTQNSLSYLYMWEKQGTTNHEITGAWHGVNLTNTTVENGVTWRNSDKYTLYNGYTTEIGIILNNTNSVQTNDILIQSYLYNGDVWNDIEEIWIYQKSTRTNNKYDAEVTLRSNIIALIDDLSDDYNGSINPGGIYTASSWSAFTAAYSAAYTVSYAGASTQAEIDNAAATLEQAYDDLELQSYNTVTVTQSGATGTVAVGDTTINTASGTATFIPGATPTVTITAPVGYYIASVVSGATPVFTNSDESVLTHSFTATVNDDINYNVTYALRSIYDVVISAYSTVGGTLYYNGDAIAAAGQTITVYGGDDVSITGTATVGYCISYWVADSVVSGHETVYSFNNVSADHTLTVEWKAQSQFTVSVYSTPNGGGTSTITDGTSTATNNATPRYIVVTERSNVTLTAAASSLYSFTGWTIDGRYNIVSGSLTDTTLEITPLENIGVTGNYIKSARRIYLKNDANWSGTTMYAYTYSTGSGAGALGAWPGTAMTRASAGSTLWYIDLPLTETQNIIFNNGPSASQMDTTVSPTYNMYNNSTNVWSAYIEDGYYLTGMWNGSEHNSDDYFNYQLTDNGDGTYSYILTVTSTADGYIYVCPCDEAWLWYEAATAGNTANPQTMSMNGSGNKAKIEIDTSDYSKSYAVTMTFNPTTGVFSWTTRPVEETITVYGYDGATKDPNDTGMPGNGRLGNTYFDISDIISAVEYTYYQEAHVVVGESVSVYTQVNNNGTSGQYDYYVAGWVINGVEFIAANSLGNGLYSGSYTFTEDGANIVPIYYHTDAWLTAHNVEMVEIYATLAESAIEGWDDYLACYAWFKTGGNKVYEQFGLWSGQLMIPVAGADGVYYTRIETTSPTGVPVSGVTFNNYSGNAPITGSTNNQTYDYEEFMALNAEGKSNITFVLKNTNSTDNNGRVSTSSVNLSDFTFVPFTDYSDIYTDIYGNNISGTYDSLSDSDALYIIRTGDILYTGGLLDGTWYVDDYFYDASGNFLGSAPSYMVYDHDSEIWATAGLADYIGQRVYVSYDALSGGRYDGEWYGDASLGTTVNLGVKVALSTNDGESYTVNTTAPVNEAIYGIAHVSETYQNVDVTRGSMVNLMAGTRPGYKFIGWYTHDGKLFTKNTTISVKAAVSGEYIAVFQAFEAGTLYVNHYLYTGTGTSTSLPPAHGGNADLYIGIVNTSTGESIGLGRRSEASILATEGDVLTITIATDATGADKFYAWYIDAVEATGLTSYEEVGVDSDTNLYDNNGTVVGRNDTVFLQFSYTVGTDFSLTFYSDIIPVAVDVMLIYKYVDRYGKESEFYVPYSLTADEIEGFAGNGNSPYTPSYISSNSSEWSNSVLRYAPFVKDFYKDSTWTITKSKYDSLAYELRATQPETMYTVTLEVNDTVLIESTPFNSTFDVDARTYGGTFKGYWFDDVNNDGEFTEGVDIILTYGPLFSYRVVRDMSISYVTVPGYDFSVSVMEPVYGRKQTTDAQGNNLTDKVYIDYILNILTPVFYYGNADKYGNSFREPIYNGETITDVKWNSLVTLESLEDAGYTIDYGVVLEQVGSFAVTQDGAYNTFAQAEAAAATEGYSMPSSAATIEAIAKGFVDNGKSKGWDYSAYGVGSANNNYYYVFDASSYPISNKNRVQFTLTYDNTASNQKRFFNAYSYLAVTYDNVTTYYISNVQTLNIYQAGTSDATTSDNYEY